jgi:hypothetical protein
VQRNSASARRIASVRSALAGAERGSGSARQATLTQLSSQLAAEAAASCDSARMRKLSDAVRDLSVVS